MMNLTLIEYIIYLDICNEELVIKCNIDLNKLENINKDNSSKACFDLNNINMEFQLLSSRFTFGDSVLSPIVKLINQVLYSY